MGPDPAEQFKAAHAGHLQISDDEIGEWEFTAVGEDVGALEIAHRLAAAVDYSDLGSVAAFLERPFQDEDLIGIVLGQQDAQVAFGSREGMLARSGCTGQWVWTPDGTPRRRVGWRRGCRSLYPAGKDAFSWAIRLGATHAEHENHCL